MGRRWKSISAPWITLALASPLAGAQAADERSAALEDQVRRLTEQLYVLRGDVDPGPASATSVEERLERFARHEAKLAATAHGDLPWQFVGPTNVSGRVTDLAVQEPRGESYTMFAATASGGVWRTQNDGITFEPVFEDGPSTSIGDVTIAPSDPNVVWVGTGEANIFRSSMAGCGVYKSTDGGDTWTRMGLEATHTIARIVIHPTNPDVVYVAASGHEWTNNEERGVYRTKDGGQTWEKVLFVDERSGAIDLVMDPVVTTTLYATTWQRIRKRWNDPRSEAGYTGSGVWRSTDGGDSWQPINEGLPAPEHRGRIGIDLCRSQPNTVYAFVDNYRTEDDGSDLGVDAYGRPKTRGSILGATIFRSDDRGTTWRQTSSHDRTMRSMGGTYGWVFGQIRVDPVNADKIYVMGLGLNVSDDSGASFRRLGGMHGDHHALWIDPQNPDFLVNGNDGGLVLSCDGGRNWRNFNAQLPVVQFFNIAIDMAEPFNVYGSVQDHGSFTGTVNLERGRGRIPAVEFQGAPGGEGCSHAVDPTDPNTVYSAGFYGSIQRTDMSQRATGGRRRGGGTVNLVPQPPEGEAPYRGQWRAPFILSPHNSRIVYHGMNFLFRSMDRGDEWERISADLTHADPRKIGDIAYQTIFAIAESHQRFGELYVGTDDGRAHRSPDGGSSWTSIDRGLAQDRWIAGIETSHARDGLVYLAQNGKRNDDFRPYLWRSDDHGQSWTSLSEGIPLGPINVVREDPVDPRILYVGTDLGVCVSLDAGKTWDVLSADLPSTFVSDLQVHPRDHVLVASTHGRGVYVLDLLPLRAKQEEQGIGAAATPGS